MKDDYYWSTLKNIVTAATVPLQREPDRSTRSLTDVEIISLIKFRDIFYEDYRDSLTGRAYLFIRINGCGIGKGGIRADAEHVLFLEKALSRPICCSKRLDWAFPSILPPREEY